MSSLFPRIAILGAGSMGGAILAGLVDSGAAGDGIVVTNRSEAKAEPLRSLPGVTSLSHETTPDANRAALDGARLVLVGVKPAMVPDLLREIADALEPEALLVSVAAGVTIETMESMSSIPEGYIEAAHSCGVSRLRMVTHVYIPATLPQTFVSLRIAMNVSVLVTMAGEFVVGNGGIGYLIFSSRQLFIMDWVYSGVVVIAIVGVILASIVTFIGRRLTPWTTSRRHTVRRRA